MLMYSAFVRPLMSAASTDSPLDRVPIVQSVVAGVAAWVVSFIVVAILVAGTEDGDDLVGFSGNVLYNAHFVDVESEGPMGSTSMESILSDGATELSEFVYYAVPLIVLVVVAIGLTRMVDIDDPTDAALAGAAMAVGYLVLTIVGTFVIEYEQTFMGATATASPVIDAMTVLLMGIIYPAVVGAVGGFVGSNL